MDPVQYLILLPLHKPAYFAGSIDQGKPVVQHIGNPATPPGSKQPSLVLAWHHIHSKTKRLINIRLT